MGKPELWNIDDDAATLGVRLAQSRSLIGHSGIVASPDNAYRYILWRVWTESRAMNLCAWVMLNPSTADAIEDDPTIKKCVGFSRRWGHDGIVVVNLFAMRSTDPSALNSSPDPVGPHNPHFVEHVLDHPTVKRVVIAWGNEGSLDARDESFCVVHGHRELWCLRPPGKATLTNLWAPRHPVRIGYASELVRVRWEGSLVVEP